jgi:hypothetical protein
MVGRKGYSESFSKRSVFDVEIVKIENVLNEALRNGRSLGSLRISDDFPFRIRYLFNYWEDQERKLKKLENQIAEVTRERDDYLEKLNKLQQLLK